MHIYFPSPHCKFSSLQYKGRKWEKMCTERPIIKEIREIREPVAAVFWVLHSLLATAWFFASTQTSKPTQKKQNTDKDHCYANKDENPKQWWHSKAKSWRRSNIFLLSGSGSSSRFAILHESCVAHVPWRWGSFIWKWVGKRFGLWSIMHQLQVLLPGRVLRARAQGESSHRRCVHSEAVKGSS